MKVISVFDTTISDHNLGNQIIMDAVYRHLRDVFPSGYFLKVPYMEITKHTNKYLKISDFTFFGGTNSLSSRMERYKQWGISLSNSGSVNDVILMGLGWWQYQQKESIYTKLLLHKVLDKNHIHSVRDSYTENKLISLGFTNVVNTGCPTLWDLTPEHCESIRKKKSDQVLFTLTDYNQDKKRDKFIVSVLKKNYSKLYFWVQGIGDFKYIKSLCTENIEIINPHLTALDHMLSSVDIDYVGTRLHAGIRAIQHKKRSIIIAVDNRAHEMSKDFNLVTVDSSNLEKLDSLINSKLETKLNIPYANIKQWKQQF